MVAEVKRRGGGVGSAAADQDGDRDGYGKNICFGWWLYYLRMSIGGVRVIIDLFWAANKYHNHLYRILVQMNQLVEQLVQGQP